MADLRRGFASNAGSRACCPLPQGGLYAVLHRRAVERGFENHRGSLRELRRPKRTKTLCHVVLEACRDAEVEFIPEEYFDLAFAMKAASFCPKALRTILYRFRSLQGRGPFTPYTAEDVKIIAEAACPKGLGQYKLSGVKNQEQELAGRTFEQYCSEVYGYVDVAYTYVYKQALDVLLQHSTVPCQGDEKA